MHNESQADISSAETDAPRLIQYLFFKLDPLCRRLTEEERTRGRREFAHIVEGTPGVRTFSYSTLGLKVDADFLLWRTASSLDDLQDMLGRLLQTGLGKYVQPTYSLFGMTRPSVYTKRRTTQEQAVDEQERLRYLTVYPFSKTTEWYLMSKEARQGMMNEHMRVGHEYAKVRQVLLYTTGLDDQEFVVAYEMEDMMRFTALVTDLRN